MFGREKISISLFTKKKKKSHHLPGGKKTHNRIHREGRWQEIHKLSTENM